MRSVIKEANAAGIRRIIDQQFEVGLQIAAAGLVPILEPEVDIHSATKAEAEKIMLEEIKKHLAALPAETKIMLKVSIPTEDGFYTPLMQDIHVLRVVALSGGYSREEANERLARNPGLIASFSRALLEGLTAGQTDEEFNRVLAETIRTVYEASIA